MVNRRPAPAMFGIALQQPHVQPALASLSAMISQYFIISTRVKEDLATNL